MMNPIKILIAEDDTWYAELLKHHLSLNPDYVVEYVENGQDLQRKIHNGYDVITLDYSLPDVTGDVLLKRVKNEFPDTEIIVVSSQEDVGTAIDLLKNGAYDYIVKDDNTKERLWNAISKISEHKMLKKEMDVLRTEVKRKYDFSKSIVGTSPAIKGVFSLLEKAAGSNINVSVTGETGTGKEVIAKAIHYNSDRSKQPFVAINVSAIPGELVESELFGHEKGAFTGAATRRIGKFEFAGKGTLFLDEIGEMDKSMQAKLLRVLQERELIRVGGTEKVKVNCRIICATHKNLMEEVQKGNFRQDLYYRLIGLPIELPALRDRPEDIILLARHFIQLFAKDNGFEDKHLSEDAKQKLLRYEFSGNVRELKAIIDLSMVLSDTNEITAEHVRYQQNDPVYDLSNAEMTMKEYNQRILDYYLNKYNHNVMKVADILGIGKSTIYRMLKEV